VATGSEDRGADLVNLGSVPGVKSGRVGAKVGSVPGVKSGTIPEGR
jgi:hypothetical protein